MIQLPSLLYLNLREQFIYKSAVHQIKLIKFIMPAKPQNISPRVKCQCSPQQLKYRVPYQMSPKEHLEQVTSFVFELHWHLTCWHTYLNPRSVKCFHRRPHSYVSGVVFGAFGGNHFDFSRRFYLGLEKLQHLLTC